MHGVQCVIRRRRRLSPWARIALREPWQFRWWSFCAAPAASLAESRAYEHTLLVAVLLALLAWLVSWLEPPIAVALGGAAAAVALWIPLAGRRIRRIRAHCLEHVRRRHARRHPEMPDWGWAVMRAQERSLTFNATPVTDPLCTAVAIVGVAAMAVGHTALDPWLGGWSAAVFYGGAGVLALALVCGGIRAERDRRRLRRAILGVQCLRCGYRLMEPELRRPMLRCRICPECGYRYPLHPPPTSGRMGTGILPGRLV